MTYVQPARDWMADDKKMADWQTVYQTLLPLDQQIRAAAEDPEDGRSVEDIMLAAAGLMRAGESLWEALKIAADGEGDHAD